MTPPHPQQISPTGLHVLFLAVGINESIGNTMKK